MGIYRFIFFIVFFISVKISHAGPINVGPFLPTMVDNPSAAFYYFQMLNTFGINPESFQQANFPFAEVHYGRNEIYVNWREYPIVEYQVIFNENSPLQNGQFLELQEKIDRILHLFSPSQELPISISGQNPTFSGESFFKDWEELRKLFLLGQSSFSFENFTNYLIAVKKYLTTNKKISNQNQRFINFIYIQYYLTNKIFCQQLRSIIKSQLNNNPSLMSESASLMQEFEQIFLNLNLNGQGTEVIVPYRNIESMHQTLGKIKNLMAPGEKQLVIKKWDQEPNNSSNPIDSITIKFNYVSIPDVLTFYPKDCYPKTLFDTLSNTIIGLDKLLIPEYFKPSSKREPYALAYAFNWLVPKDKFLTKLQILELQLYGINPILQFEGFIHKSYPIGPNRVTYDVNTTAAELLRVNDTFLNLGAINIFAPSKFEELFKAPIVSVIDKWNFYQIYLEALRKTYLNLLLKYELITISGQQIQYTIDSANKVMKLTSILYYFSNIDFLDPLKANTQTQSMKEYLEKIFVTYAEGNIPLLEKELISLFPETIFSDTGLLYNFQNFNSNSNLAQNDIVLFVEDLHKNSKDFFRENHCPSNMLQSRIE